MNTMDNQADYKETFVGNKCNTEYKCGCIYNLYIEDDVVFYTIKTCDSHQIKNSNHYNGRMFV